MTEYTLDAGSVLIIPGYTDSEVLQLNGGTTTQTNDETNTNNTSSSTDKLTNTTTTDSISTNRDNTSITTNNEIKPPNAMYFHVKNVEYTPQIKDYEEFNSAQGLILIEKACDRYAEVKFDVLVHQKLSSITGNLQISNEDKRGTNLYVEDFHQAQAEGGFELWQYPQDYNDKFIELRRSFFDNLRGRPLTIISPLFPNITVGYMTECDYSISEGEEEASYNITIREVTNTGF